MSSPAQTYLDVVKLLRAERRIDATRVIRDRFGLTLREAMELMEVIGASITR